MKARWKLQTARMRCPHCKKIVWMTYRGNWKIFGKYETKGREEDADTDGKASADGKTD